MHRRPLPSEEIAPFPPKERVRPVVVVVAVGPDRQDVLDHRLGRIVRAAPVQIPSNPALYRTLGRS